MKKLLIMCLLMCSMLLVGCSKVSETKEVVEVDIIECICTPEHSTYRYRDGGEVIETKNLAEYRTIIRYNNKNYTISGEKYFEKYKKNAGKKGKALLVTTTYDNGMVFEDLEAYFDILGLEGL